jgi:glyoxylate reductase
VVGAGRIGREVARRAGVFGMRVVYWDRAPVPALETDTGAAYRDLAALLAEADVVSIHLPLTAETHHIIDGAAIQAMKPTAVLVNTARGPIVDQDALVAALEAGRLRAAGLDVFEEEPAIPDRLRSLPNVVLLPHLGSATEEARRAMWDTAWENLLRGIQGEPLLTPVALS